MTARFIEVRDFNGERGIPFNQSWKPKAKSSKGKFRQIQDISELRRILGKETKRNWETEVKTQNVWKKDRRNKGLQKDSGHISNGWQKESRRTNSMIYPFDTFKLSKLSVCDPWKKRFWKSWCIYRMFRNRYLIVALSLSFSLSTHLYSFRCDVSL